MVGHGSDVSSVVLLVEQFGVHLPHIELFLDFPKMYDTAT